jgi:hypothetical protein
MDQSLRSLCVDRLAPEERRDPRFFGPLFISQVTLSNLNGNMSGAGNRKLPHAIAVPEVFSEFGMGSGSRRLWLILRQGSLFAPDILNY